MFVTIGKYTVNIDHIIAVERDAWDGTNIHLTDGQTMNVTQDYNKVVEAITS